MSDTLLVALASEVATTGQFNRVTKLPRIISPSSENDSLLKAVQAMKAILDAREGVSGSVLDKNLTLRDLMDAGALQIKVGNTTLGGLLGDGIAFPSTAGVGSTPGYVDPRPLLIAPPTLTALTATGTLRTVFLKWSMLEYRNHAHVEVWRATTNSLGSAVMVGLSLSSLYVDEGVAASVAYFYWVRAIGYDTAGAPIVGSFNGVSGTAGGAQMIGNVDLGPLIVQAGNIAAQAVDTSKMTVSDFSTIADNPTFEAGDVGWNKEAGWTIINSPANAFNGNWVAARTGGGVTVLRNQLFVPAIVGDEFYFEAMVKCVGVTGNGAFARLTVYNAAGAEVGAFAGNNVASTGYTKSGASCLLAAGVSSVRVEIVADITAGTVYVDNVRFQRKLTLNHLAAGSIAVGTAAIQNGAIVNAMIGTAAIDDAKIANLAADKVTFGTMSGNRIAVGTLQADRIAANTITAGQIASNTITAGQIAANTITAAQIAANAITTATLNAGAVTAAKISVAQLDALSATIGLLRTAVSGARQEIASNYIKVFDASNVKRVQIGDLSA